MLCGAEQYFGKNPAKLSVRFNKLISTTSSYGISAESTLALQHNSDNRLLFSYLQVFSVVAFLATILQSKGKVTNIGNGEPGVWELVYSGNSLSKWRRKEKKRLEEEQFG